MAPSAAMAAPAPAGTHATTPDKPCHNKKNCKSGRSTQGGVQGRGNGNTQGGVQGGGNGNTQGGVQGGGNGNTQGGVQGGGNGNTQGG
ncbi:hypothetical protein, partial [Streptomyces sp. NPDC001781]